MHATQVPESRKKKHKMFVIVGYKSMSKQKPRLLVFSFGIIKRYSSDSELGSSSANPL